MVSFRRGGLFSLVLASVLLFGVAIGARAQQVFGSIIGTVSDPSGSAVANAKVTITDTTKGTSSDVTTNDAGQYSKGQLIPDQYTVTVEAAGFQKVVSNPLTVQVDQATQFNATMTVGNVQQTVEVTAAAPLLQTDRADVAQTFTSEQISQLPSIGRNLQSFELLNPGTVKQAWAHASDEDPQGSIQIQVNGQPFYATGYYLDGTVNQDPILGIIVINPTFDSVNEVKQAGQDYDSEFDTFSAGLLTYSTKSGSNSLHGDAFEFLYVNTPGFQDFGRNPFTENTPIGGHAGSFSPTTHQNQFGGSIGGRIIKDKLFFFGDAQLTRNIKGGSVLASVPTLQDRTGNLGDWLAFNSIYQIYDPNTGNPTTGVGRTAFAGNVIPMNRISPQALAIMNYFPLPNAQGTVANGVVAPYNNYEASGGLTNNGNVWDTRWDYYVNEKNTVFGRYSYAAFDLGAPGAFGLLAGGPSFNNANYAGSSSTLNQSIAGGWTYTASATLINEFRFGFLHYHVTDVPNGVGTSPATQAGIPGLNLDNFYTSGMPYFDIRQQNTNGSAGTDDKLGYSLDVNACNCPLDENERQYQFVDNITKVHGNHSFKFGADIRYALNLRVPSDSHRAGQLVFDSYMTSLGNGSGTASGGLGLATFLLGDVSQFTRYVSSSTNAQERQKRLFWYGQDEWRPNPKLTVTYGLRWEMIFPETVNGPQNGAEYNLNTGLLDVFGYGLNGSHGYQSMNWKNFAPRLGIAYQLTPKTVIRTGYGWSYSLGTFGSTFGHNVTQNPPVLANQSLSQQQTCGNNFCDVFTLASGAPAPPSFSVSPQGTLPCPAGVDCKTRPLIMTLPVTYNYNFTVQQQLTKSIAVTGGYVGNSGRHQTNGSSGDTYNANQIFFLPGFTGKQNTLAPFNGLYGPRYNYGNTSAIDNYANSANTRYDSFQGTVTVRAMAGLTLQGNYTYQLSQGDGGATSSYQGLPNRDYTFLYDRALGYTNNNDFPLQQWVMAPTYDLPFGRGRKYGANVNKFVDAVLGGWNLSGIFTYYTGLPFYPTIDSYPGKPYTGPNNVPDKGTGSPIAPNANRNQWILPLSSGAYTLPAPNTFGNYPINKTYGPQFVNLDASIMKQFSITERFKFTLRMDATNSLNHANLGMPNTDVQSPSVGQITNLAYSNNQGAMRRLQFSGVLKW
ncbi:MAG: TonB-dependent receptor [Acidobacteriaceae bacterium]|nr:TonB-dependent receptor [Acidobacteriaceae bacterium]MBV9499576.1 TonB-dependent receptor [Acidobacteriaceae bacterium]